MDKRNWVSHSKTRTIALMAGILYIVTFISAIPAVFLLDPLLNDPNFIVGNGSHLIVISGILLDLVNAIACVGTAVVLYPVVKRQSDIAANGYLASRILEAAIIVIGVVCLLAIVTLRNEGLSGESALFVARTLVDIRDWTFLLGPGLVPAFNAFFLGYALYKSKLVPRIIPTLGLIGAPLLLLAAIGTIYGVNTQDSIFSAIATLPIFLWELSVGLWMIGKGFNASSPIFQHN